MSTFSMYLRVVERGAFCAGPTVGARGTVHRAGHSKSLKSIFSGVRIEAGVSEFSSVAALSYEFVHT